MENIPIDYGCRVKLYYSISLLNGTIVESTGNETPEEFTLGDGTFTENLERAIFGLKKTDYQKIEIEAREGFGFHDKSKVQCFKQSDFSKDIDLKEGLIIHFEDTNKNQLPGMITNINDSDVTVDFNHPLADQAIYLKLKF